MTTAVEVSSSQYASGQERLEMWALVELFGHQRIAGRVTEATIAGGTFLRVDVPDGATRFFGAAAIYSISPVSEEVARMIALHEKLPPVGSWDARLLLTGRRHEAEMGKDGDSDGDADDGVLEEG